MFYIIVRHTPGGSDAGIHPCGTWETAIATANRLKNAVPDSDVTITECRGTLGLDIPFEPLSDWGRK